MGNCLDCLEIENDEIPPSDVENERSSLVRSQHSGYHDFGSTIGINNNATDSSIINKSAEDNRPIRQRTRSENRSSDVSDGSIINNSPAVNRLIHQQTHHENDVNNREINKQTHPKNRTSHISDDSIIKNNVRCIVVNETTEPKLCCQLLINNNAVNFSQDISVLKHSRDTFEYQHVSNEFMRTTQRHFQVLEINEVFNPYLMASFILRKKEYELLYGEEMVRVELVFHGTTSDKAIQIIRNNFNWRFAGSTVGHKYGVGICFSHISNYADNYSEKDKDKKVMLGVKILRAFDCHGKKYMKMPPICRSGRSASAHFDTTIKPDGKVCVKYRDDEFYPAYLIKYTGTTIKKST